MSVTSARLKVKKLSKKAEIPSYQSEGASGMDLHALENVVVNPGDTVLIRTGIAFDIPKGFEVQIRPRSGLSAKTGLIIPNAPGTIDHDFTGEIKVIMRNTSNKFEIIDAGSRIAQAVLAPVTRAEILEVNELKETKRSNQGFGSTGL